MAQTQPARTNAEVRTQPEDTDRMPSGIPFIVGNEAAERFSFYGMKGILVVFMTQYLVGLDGQPAGLDDDAATAIYHRFTAAVYLFPILGALLADHVLGKYRVIISLSVVYCLGHLVLGLMEHPQLTGIEPKTMLLAGLGLIALGSGGIKPCVSAHVGDQFGPRNAHLLERVFGWFYFSINLGAFASTIICPWLLDHEDFGPSWAFGLPGGLMLLATVVFWLGRRRYAHVPPSGVGEVKRLLTTEWRSVARVLPLFAFLVVFWAIFDQTGARWVLQADRMDQAVGGSRILPSQMQSANPLMVMLLIPLFQYVVYPALSKVVTLTPLRKIGVGLLLAGFSAVQSGWIEQAIQANPEAPPSILWQLLPYLTLTASEVLVSIVGLEFAYSQAPRAMKSIVMALFFSSVTVGNLVVAEVNEAISENAELATSLEGAAYFNTFAIAAVVVAAAFAVWASFYRYETVLQTADSGDVEAEAVG